MAAEPPLHTIDPDAVAAGRRALPSEAVLLAGVVDAFAALSDATRVRMLYALIRQPLCVRDLAIVAGISESAVSHYSPLDTLPGNPPAEDDLLDEALMLIEQRIDLVQIEPQREYTFEYRRGDGKFVEVISPRWWIPSSA